MCVCVCDGAWATVSREKWKKKKIEWERKRYVSPNMMMYAHCKHLQDVHGNGEMLMCFFLFFSSQYETRRQNERCAVCSTTFRFHFVLAATIQNLKPNNARRPTGIPWTRNNDFSRARPKEQTFWSLVGDCESTARVLTPLVSHRQRCPKQMQEQ